MQRTYDLIALLQPTSPVREIVTLEEAFAHIDRDVVDAVIGVAPARIPPDSILSARRRAEIYGRSGTRKGCTCGRRTSRRRSMSPATCTLSGRLC